MLCCRCVVWCVAACCDVLGHVVVVACGCVWLWFVVVFTLCVVVWGCSASWCVVFRAGTWWVPRVTSLLVRLCCAVCLCVLVLGCVLRGVRFCVLRWGWFGVGFRLVVLCGVVARLVAFRCGTLPCGLLRCVVLLLLFPVGLVGLWFYAVVLWQFLWSFSLLSVVVWLIIGVLCWYVSGAVLHVVVFYREVVWFLYFVVACVVSWRVMLLSCCASVRWVVRWCAASGIVTRCCVLLLGGLLFCVACCVA